MTTPVPAQRNQTLTGVVKDWGGRLFNFIRRRVGSDEDAEDVMQDVWQQLSAQPEVEAIGQLSSWLYEVARNRIVDRSRKSRESLVDDVAPPDADGESLGLDQFLVSEDTPEGLYLNRLFWETLSASLEQLPPEQRYVFVENELEGRPLREQAEETGENIKTLIYRKGAAVQALRRTLADLHAAFSDTME
ncbi:MAG: sigma-70 family RNA polymerase sigma factor [Rhodoferax sp.]|nr:sigma-70 family RNA polymerase sigma factor [Rhodoferax sp.]